MILEVVILNIIHGREKEFEMEFAQASPIIAKYGWLSLTSVTALRRSGEPLSAVGAMGKAGRSHRWLSRLGRISGMAKTSAPLL